MSGTTAMRALLVEDDDAFSGLLIDSLEMVADPPLHIERARRLSDAQARLADTGFDVVLLDLNLPDSRGLDTLNQIVGTDTHLPVIVLTGLDDMALATEAVRRGAQDWLTKGRLDPEIVVRAIRYAVERKSLGDRLLRSQKMEAVGLLAGTVAHDFNNLLTVILANVELAALDATQDVFTSRQALQEVRRAAERAADLTQQLLGLARKQIIQPKIVSVIDLIDGIRGVLDPMPQENVTITVHIDPDAGYVRIDRAQFEQILINLVLNARDAMPDGGKLSIRARRSRLADGTAESVGLAPGEYAVLEVADTGVGISADVLPKIFEPFFTTKISGRGTGLGLAVCHGIVTQHGGDLRVRSSPGRGTTFSIYLPRVDRPVQTERPTPGRLAFPGSGTILLVEDEPTVRTVAAETLRRMGWTVHEADSGEDALGLVATRLTDIDLLVTDLMMPKMGGRELAARLRTMRPGLRVLFMSGYSQEIAASPEMLQNEHFLRKPFSPLLLAQRVRDAAQS